MMLGAGLIGWPLMTSAQRPLRMPRIGVIWGDSGTGVSVDALKRGLSEAGYSEGRNIVLEHRAANGDFKRYPRLVAELLKVEVDILVTTSVRATQVAAKLTKRIPIVVIGAGDLVSTGLARSLARPGGNVTGIIALSPELSAKRLELLKEIVPTLKRVAVLWNPDGPAPLVAFKETEAAAKQLALEIQSIEARVPDDFERMSVVLDRAPVQGMLVIIDPLTAGHSARIVELVAERRLPSIYPGSWFVTSGGLVSYGPNYTEMFRQAARYIDRILRGTSPAELSIAQPTKYELHLNLKTARSLGLAISPSIRLRADRVIE